MYPATDAFNKFLYANGDKNNTAKLVWTDANGDIVDVSRFVSKFGSISRSIEYDTGKFTPSRHSFTLDNTQDVGDYLFTLRHKINGINTPGTTYWNDLQYSLYYGWLDTTQFTASNDMDTVINIYNGIIRSKKEDRIKEEVSVASDDVLIRLQQTLVCLEDKTPDDVFDYIVPANTDVTPMIHGVRYGEILYEGFPASETVTTGCTISWGGAALLYNSRIVTLPIEHNLMVGSYLRIADSSIPEYNLTYYVASVLDGFRVYVYAVGALQTTANCSVAIPTYSEQKTNSETPFGCIGGIKLPFIGNKEGGAVGTRYTVTAAYSGGAGNTYLRTTENLQLNDENTLRAFSKMTNTAYNFNGQGDTWRSSTAITQSGTDLLLTFATALPYSTGEMNLTIKYSTAGYNGNYTATILTANTAKILNQAFISNETALTINNNLVKFNMTFTATDTGYLYIFERAVNLGVYETTDVGFLWYFPIRNYCSWGKVKLNYWDYISNLWCDFNSTNVTTNFIREYGTDATTVTGLYLYIKTNYIEDKATSATHAIEHKWDDSQSWTKYLDGTGYYFTSTEPMPQLMLEFQYSGISIGGSDYNSNPVAVLYDILTHSRMCGLPTSYLDWHSFSVPDTTYTWDYVTNFFLNAGSWTNCGKINIVVDKQTSIMAIVQDIIYKCGLYLSCGSIRPTDDRRIRLILNKDYVHATDNPMPQLTFGTDESVSKLDISTTTDRLTDKVLLQRYVNRYYYGYNGYWTNVVKEGDSSYKPLQIGTGNDPMVYWIDSQYHTDIVAQNYLNKLGNAWENVSIDLDDKAIYVDCGDYVKIYDEKANEYIVIQVYDWSLDLDTGNISLSGKMEWSSKS